MQKIFPITSTRYIFYYNNVSKEGEAYEKAIRDNLGLFILLFIEAVIICLVYFFCPEFHTVISGSMEPAIPTGSLAIVDRNADISDIEIGDVIVFSYNEKLIIHRVIDEAEIDGKKYLKTKGDANRSDDGFITSENNFHGKAIYSIPKLGYIFDHDNLIKDNL